VADLEEEDAGEVSGPTSARGWLTAPKSPQPSSIVLAEAEEGDKQDRPAKRMKASPDPAQTGDDEYTSQNSEEDVMNANAVPWASLPDEALDVLVSQLPIEWRGVVKHVSSGILAAVKRADADTGSITRLGMEQLASSREMMAWGIQQRCPKQQMLMNEAAGRGWLDVLQLGKSKRCPIRGKDMCERAARNGHLHVLQWAVENRYRWDHNTCAAAVEGGHFETFKWVVDNCGWWTPRWTGPWNDRQTVADVATTGNLDFLKYVIQSGMATLDGDPEVGVAAARVGSLPILKWLATSALHLKKRGTKEWHEICEAAAEHGRVEVLLWLRTQKRCRMDEGVCKAAARGGSIQALQWLRNHHCPWDATALYAAAEAGHIHVLQWVDENNPPPVTDYNSEITMTMARKGHLETLKLLNEGNFPLHRHTAAVAIEHGQVGMVKWLVETDPDWYGPEMLIEVAAHNQVDLLQWLIHRGETDVVEQAMDPHRRFIIGFNPVHGVEGARQMIRSALDKTTHA